MADDSFHAYLIYAWHYAKCPGMTERTLHSHALRSYDRDWLHRMHRRITDGDGTWPRRHALNDNEMEQINLEAQTAALTQKRKSLEADIKWNQ
jgi:hypothetical protein